MRCVRVCGPDLNSVWVCVSSSISECLCLCPFACTLVFVSVRLCSYLCAFVCTCVLVPVTLRNRKVDHHSTAPLPTIPAFAHLTWLSVLWVSCVTCVPYIPCVPCGFTWLVVLCVSSSEARKFPLIHRFHASPVRREEATTRRD